MNTIENIKFIEGTFSPDETREILSGVLSSKINFHKVKNFSSQIRHGKDDDIAQKRIPELSKELEKLQEIISQARANNHNLIVTSEIHISISAQ